MVTSLPMLILGETIDGHLVERELRQAGFAGRSEKSLNPCFPELREEIRSLLRATRGIP